MERKVGGIQQNNGQDRAIDFIRENALVREIGSKLNPLGSKSEKVLHELQESLGQSNSGSSGVNKMKYRSRLTIASSILQGAQNGSATKTRLMYGAYLSFAQMNEYLAFLQTNALIMKNELAHTYAITEKGNRFLRIFEELTKTVSI